MAYLIECHVIDDDDQIRTTVSFYGSDQAEAQETYEARFATFPILVLAEKAGMLIEEEMEIPDEDRPEVEDEPEEEEEGT